MIIIPLVLTVTILVIISVIYNSTSAIKNLIKNKNKESISKIDSFIKIPNDSLDVKPNFTKVIELTEDAKFLYVFFSTHTFHFISSENSIQENLDLYKKRFFEYIITENSEESISGSRYLNSNYLWIKKLFSSEPSYSNQTVKVWDELFRLESSLRYIINHTDSEQDVKESCLFIYNNLLFKLFKSLYLYNKNSLILEQNDYLNNIELFRKTSEEDIYKIIQNQLKIIEQYKKKLDVNFLLDNFSNTTFLHFDSKFNTIEILIDKILELSENDENNIEIKVTVSNMKTSVIPKIKTWSEDKTLNKKDINTINIVLDKIINILRSYKSNIYKEDNEITNEIQIINRYLGYLEKPESSLSF